MVTLKFTRNMCSISVNKIFGKSEEWDDWRTA